MGRRRPGAFQNRADGARLKRALYALGGLLAEQGISSRLRRSRLMLAEALLAARGGLLDDELASLPLVRVYRFPDDSEEAWSIDRLVEARAQRRAFSGPSRMVRGSPTGLLSPGTRHGTWPTPSARMSGS